MYWILLSLGAAFFNSASGVFKKKSGFNKMDPYTVAWAVAFFALIILVPAAIIKGVPQINSAFWWALVISGSLNALATVLQVKAIFESELSLVGPLQATTPLFLVFTSFFILGEFPTILGFFGITTIMLGSYFLEYKRNGKGLL